MLVFAAERLVLATYVATVCFPMKHTSAIAWVFLDVEKSVKDFRFQEMIAEQRAVAKALLQLCLSEVGF